MSVVLALVLLAFAVAYLFFASTGASEQEVL
jgi:hypothetical protein